MKGTILERQGSFREMKDQYHEMELSFNDRIDELTLILSNSTQVLDDILEARRVKSSELDAVIDGRKSEIDGLAIDMERMIRDFAEVLAKIYTILNQTLNVPRIVDRTKLSFTPV